MEMIHRTSRRIGFALLRRCVKNVKAETKNHPQAISFCFSAIAMIFVLFYSPSDKAVKDRDIANAFRMVNIEKIALPKRKTKKQIDVNAEKETVPDETERAEGLSESEDAVDLSFFPNVVPPRPVGKLQKIYPEEARRREVEATVYVRLLIGKKGEVQTAQVLATHLSKSLPQDAAETLKAKFAGAAVKILQNARFSPPIVDGKHVSIVMEMPLKFELN